MENKTLHIDTLYLSYDCDFQSYLKAIDILPEKPFLYIRAGRHYYDFGFARVGWLDWEICQKSKNYPFVIEYNFEYLFQTDLLSDYTHIKLPFHDSFDNYLVKRLDYNCTFKTLNHNILQSIFVSPYFQKGHNWYDGKLRTETINLGKRSTGKTFRIYNKSKELSDKKNHIKNDMLKQKFGDLKNLYSLEVELHRKYILSRTKSKGRLSDFTQILDVAKILLGSVKYCEHTQKNIALIRSKNYDKIVFKYINTFIGSIDFVQVKQYEKSRENLLIAIENLLSQYNAYEGETLSHDELAKEISFKDLSLD